MSLVFPLNSSETRRGPGGPDRPGREVVLETKHRRGSVHWCVVSEAGDGTGPVWRYGWGCRLCTRRTLFMCGVEPEVGSTLSFKRGTVGYFAPVLGTGPPSDVTMSRVVWSDGQSA